MAPKRRALLEQHDQPAWIVWVKVFWIALLATTCYFMAQDMVHHHFFHGGALNGRIEDLSY